LARFQLPKNPFAFPQNKTINDAKRRSTFRAAASCGHVRQRFVAGAQKHFVQFRHVRLAHIKRNRGRGVFPVDGKFPHATMTPKSPADFFYASVGSHPGDPNGFGFHKLWLGSRRMQATSGHFCIGLVHKNLLA